MSYLTNKVMQTQYGLIIYNQQDSFKLLAMGKRYVPAVGKALRVWWWLKDRISLALFRGLKRFTDYKETDIQSDLIHNQYTIVFIGIAWRCQYMTKYTLLYLCTEVMCMDIVVECEYP